MRVPDPLEDEGGRMMGWTFYIGMLIGVMVGYLLAGLLAMSGEQDHG